MNLYEELVGLLKYNGKDVSDIDWVRSSDIDTPLNAYEISVDDFISAAKNTDYDANSYMNELNGNLKVYGKDRAFVIVVDEYDGKMSLDYISVDDKKPSESKKIDTFFVEPDKNSIAYRLSKRN